MNDQEKRDYNFKQARRKMGLRSLERVSEAMAQLGTEIDPGTLGNAVSMYLETIVHEANRLPPEAEGYSKARWLARAIQWFADTASEGAASFNMDCRQFKDQ